MGYLPSDWILGAETNTNGGVEGKYPERQAYNAKGILVTFPTPEYKADAIKRGTHFEEDPTRKAQNVFQSSTPGSAPKKPADDGGKTNLPLSQIYIDNLGFDTYFHNQIYYI